MNVNLLQILERVLGNSTPKSKGNYAFHCPFCKHSKQKLEVQPDSQNWNCWVCGTKGKSLYTLLKRANARPNQLADLTAALPKSKRRVELQQDIEPINSCKLPKEYTPLWLRNNKDFFWKTCIAYLEGRGVTAQDILKYRIGYCTSGRYKNMIIFPNYNKSGELTYFTTRTFINSNSDKFINPPYSRDVVGFEMQLNWDLPLILVESALDAIILKRNASPLYGTTLSKSIKLQILENQVQDVYIILDSDALRKAISHAEYLMGFGINIYFVKLPAGEDPNSMGYDRVWELIQTTPKLCDDLLFEYKIQNLL